jgi:hypothetical protein
MLMIRIIKTTGPEKFNGAESHQNGTDVFTPGGKPEMPDSSPG